MADLPKYLYKYRTWSNPLHRRIITHNEIWFASPRSFNDPFDCSLQFRLDQITKEDLATLLDSNKDKLSEAEKQVFSIVLSSEDFTNSLVNILRRNTDFWENYLVILHKEIGIFTVAKSKKEILLWSHYSDSHRGFCVELSVPPLVSFLNRQSSSKNATFGVYPVQYGKDYPTLGPVANEDTFRKLVLTKYKRWEYEEEFRAVVYGDSDLVVNLPSSCISKLVLGWQMPDSDQEEILHELLKREDRIPVERAVKSKDKFALEFEPVEY